MITSGLDTDTRSAELVLEPSPTTSVNVLRIRPDSSNKEINHHRRQ